VAPNCLDLHKTIPECFSICSKNCSCQSYGVNGINSRPDRIWHFLANSTHDNFSLVSDDFILFFKNLVADAVVNGVNSSLVEREDFCIIIIEIN
jgi:hypothetical protein